MIKEHIEILSKYSNKGIKVFNDNDKKYVAYIEFTTNNYKRVLIEYSTDIKLTEYAATHALIKYLYTDKVKTDLNKIYATQRSIRKVYQGYQPTDKLDISNPPQSKQLK